ncbi:hypothetical protein SeMB42_g05578 [Synchytrium endobioticum]|uniref:Rab-GAP TBC domain-containing protein n=1 Tax=Synchytrium endobioticum TaxID=286115 RepID=A0A507CQI9_9FUNG|nr:hypothetical protein SeMB42_g05578 [Synchytrium endobioticum]TPX47021.1 hypothetical protein SeLEV6574_g02878 [Synchytrium endobioticum]
MEFFKSATLDALQARGLGGQVREYRSLYWKIYLEHLPPRQPDRWPRILTEARIQYDQLRQKYIFDPATAAQGARNWSLNNPLSLDEESPWKQYFADVDLQKVIKQDVERTFPDEAFFRDELIQNIMIDILFIWCKLNPDVSYRQGMHEVLAPILMVVYQDRLEEHDLDPLKTAVFSPVHIEHDTWVLYDKVMKSARIWYETGEDGDPRRISSASSRKYVDFRASQTKKMIPVVAMCKRIQGDLLRATDFDLCFHLERVGVEPQLYGIRWLRLLFGREFPLHELLILWDGIFADSPTLSLCEWICVAMLIAARREVMGQDFSMILHRLMKPPTDGTSSSAVFYINSARSIRNRYIQTKMPAPGGDLPSQRPSYSSLVPQSHLTADSSIVAGEISTAQPKKRGMQPWTMPMAPAMTLTSTNNLAEGNNNIKHPLVNDDSLRNSSSVVNSVSSASSLSSRTTVTTKAPVPNILPASKPAASDTAVQISPAITVTSGTNLAEEARVRERLAKLELEAAQRDERDLLIIGQLRRHVTILSASLLGGSLSPLVVDALQGLKSVIAELGGYPFAPIDTTSDSAMIAAEHGIALNAGLRADEQHGCNESNDEGEKSIMSLQPQLSWKPPKTWTEATLPLSVHPPSKSPGKSEGHHTLPSEAQSPKSILTSSSVESPQQPHEDVWPTEMALEATLKHLATPSMSSLNSITNGDENDPWGGKAVSNMENPAVEAMMKGWAKLSSPMNGVHKSSLSSIADHLERNGSRSSSEGSSSPTHPPSYTSLGSHFYPAQSHQSFSVRRPSLTPEFFDSVVSTVSHAALNAAAVLSEGIEETRIL